MRINGEFIKREIAGDIILVPVGETALKLNGMITITETGSVIWDDIQKGMSKEEIIEHLYSIYDVDREMLQKDLNEFLSVLERHKLIVETES